MLQARDMYLNFGDNVIFDGISLTIQNGEKIGLIGRNGAGKTTLLKVLASQLRPDSGTIDKAGDITVGYLPQHIQLRDPASPFMQCRKAIPRLETLLTRIHFLENELQAEPGETKVMAISQELAELHEEMRVHSFHNWEEQVTRVLKGLGFNDDTMYQSIETLSGGWKMRVEMAKLLLLAPEVLLMDEPTNHLDIHAIIWLESFLDQYPGSVVLISHDKTFLDKVTKRTILIENGALLDLPYSYSRALEEKEQQDEIQSATYAMQQKQIAQKERLIERFRAKASKAKFAKALQKEIDRMDKVTLPDEGIATLKIRFPQAGREGAVVAKFRNAEKHYGDNRVIANLNLEIERGERIGIVGQNGQGKTTLIKMVTREEELTEGIMETGHNIQLAYYPQNAAERLDGNLTVLETMEEASPEDMRTRLRGILGAFLFPNEDVDKKVKVLSGGERSRLALARLLLRTSNVLILDEPTHHLDIPSKNILKQALEQYAGTLILVSHDRDFLKGLVGKIIAFREGQIRKFPGGIEEYLDSISLENMRQVEMQEPQLSISSHGQKNKQEIKKELSFEEKKRLKREIRQIEKRIEELEKVKRNFEESMMDKGFYMQPDHDKLLGKYEACCAELIDLESAWEEKIIEFEE